MRRVLDPIADAHHGVVGYSVIDLENNVTISRRGDETFPTASLIKVAVLVTVYDLVGKRDLSLNDPRSVLKIDQVPGTGVTQYLHPGSILTVHDAAWLMITISDNTTTNLLLDRIIIRRVWDKMEALGLKHTKIHSKSFRRNSSVAMDSSVKYGLGMTTLPVGGGVANSSPFTNSLGQGNCGAVVRFRKQARDEALSLGNPLDLDGDRINPLLEPLEATRIVRQRCRSGRVACPLPHQSRGGNCDRRQYKQDEEDRRG